MACSPDKRNLIWNGRYFIEIILEDTNGFGYNTNGAGIVREANAGAGIISKKIGRKRSSYVI